MKTAMPALLVLCMLVPGLARADELPLVAAFPLSGAADVAEHLPILDQSLRAEIRKSSAHALLTQEKLGENLLMGPAESLAFCAGEAGCIADMGGEAGVVWIVYGDLKRSFDHSKLLIHLVLVDVKQRKQAAETFGQVEPEKAPARIRGLVRELLGIPEPIPPPVATAPAAPTPKAAPEVLAEQGPPDAKGPERETKAEIKPGAVAIEGQAPAAAPAIWDNPWTWTAAGVGVAALAAATGLGVLSQQREDDARRLAITDHPAAKPKLVQAEDYALGANVLFGLGAAGLATAVVLIVLDATDEAPAVQPSVACGAAGCGASLSMRF